MALHPQIVDFLGKLQRADITPVHQLTPAMAREQFEAMVEARDIEPAPVGSVRELSLPGPGGPLPARAYHPPSGPELPPLLVYFHGGGHVIGSLDTHDAVARNLCAGASCVVLSVDYRLAPEAKFPAAADDAYAALRWAAANGSTLDADAGRLAVGGDSAGGNLAAVAALMARDSGGPALRSQLLVYPITDYSCDRPSYRLYATGYGTLEAVSMHWFRDHYLRSSHDADDWRASPLKAPALQGLPGTVIITAQYDVLHDDGKAYAEALTAAGVDVEHRDFAGMIHGFFSLAPAIDAAVEAQAAAASALARAFRG